jgi:hypothetical protein
MFGTKWKVIHMCCASTLEGILGGISNIGKARRVIRHNPWPMDLAGF